MGESLPIFANGAHGGSLQKSAIFKNLRFNNVTSCFQRFTEHISRFRLCASKCPKIAETRINIGYFAVECNPVYRAESGKSVIWSKLKRPAMLFVECGRDPKVRARLEVVSPDQSNDSARS